MSGLGSAKSSSSTGSGSGPPAVCSTAEYLTASGGESGAVGPRLPDPTTGCASWTITWNRFGDGLGFFHEIIITCCDGVVTATARAVGDEAEALCGTYTVYPTIEIVSHDPILVIVTYDSCMEVWIPGPITVSE